MSHDDIALRAHHGTVGMLRQSDFSQVEAHTGSRLMQSDTVFTIAEQYGVAREDVILFEGKGESAAGAKPRPEWDQMIELVESHRVGLVIFVDHHRLSRNTRDTDALLRACRGRGVFIHVGKQVFDPNRYQDRGFLRVLSAATSLISEGQTEWFEDSKYSLAQRLALRLKLPTGLVWASPDDPAYRQAMERAGLTHWLERTPERHAECSILDGRRLFILPFPDADVVRACELRVQWLLETQSVSEVAKRIRSGAPPWPRKGLVPHGSVVRWTPATRATWQRPSKHNLSDWMRSPLIFGIYATYRHHFARVVTGPQPVRPKKGKHYTRAGQRLLAPLADAVQLLRVAPAGRLVAPGLHDIPGEITHD